MKTGWRTSTAALVAALAFSAPLAAQHRPPASPPAEWRPLSINLEEIQYPHPVHYLNLNLCGQDVRIAYMDVVGRANGQSVVLLHGGSYYETKSMVLGGTEDGPSFPALARRAANTLPNAELVLIPNAGHNPHEEVPDKVNAELIRFLSSDPNVPADDR